MKHMKKLAIGAMLTVCAIGPYIALNWQDVSAHARKGVYAVRVFQDEGNTTEPHAVACTDAAWTEVVAKDPESRSVLFIALGSNTAGVCITTITTTAYACVDGTPGFELGAGASVTDYTHAKWNCRMRSGGAGTIKGTRSKDNRDQTFGGGE